MTTDERIDSIIHEVNVAHSIDCNPQARYHISKQCKIIRNEVEKKWNELGFWLNNNPEATLADIQLVREILNKSNHSIRGVKVDQLKELAYGLNS